MRQILREIPGTACWFGAYETFLRLITPPGVARKDVHPLTIVFAGGLGGMGYWTAFYPAGMYVFGDVLLFVLLFVLCTVDLFRSAPFKPSSVGLI